MIVERSTPQCSAHWATDMSPVSTCTNAWYFSAGVKNRFARRPPRSRACFGSGISGSPHESHDPSHMRTDRGPRSGHELRRKAVALENADDLALREPFGEAALEVVAGAWLGAEAGEHDPPQRMVRLAVPAPVEPMAGDLPR